jgi:predicted  nucleic acid-binding Zn-ribbon protein
MNNKDSSLVIKVLSFISALKKELLKKSMSTRTDSHGRLSDVKSQYEDLKKEFEKIEIEAEDIDNIS